MSKFLQRLTSLDIFHKSSEEVKQRSSYGAAITIVGAICILLLCFGETSFYLSPPEYTSTLSVNHIYKAETIPLYMRILFMELPCDAVYVDAMDRFGELMKGPRQTLMKHNWRADFGTLINSDGKLAYRWFDRSYEREERFWERLRGYTFERPEDECLSCHIENTNQGHSGHGNCCNTCLRLKQVFVENGRSAEQADSYPQCQGPKEGCLVEGELSLNQYRGNLHILAGSSHAVYGGHTHHGHPAIVSSGSTPLTTSIFLLSVRDTTRWSILWTVLFTLSSVSAANNISSRSYQRHTYLL